MGDFYAEGGKMEDSDMIELTGKIMIVAVVILFLVMVFVFLLHIYAKWFWNRRRGDSPNPSAALPRHRPFEFAPGTIADLRRGLDPSELKTIPVLSFNAKDFKDGLECAVCLCDVSEGEKARLLPKCNHGFHLDCIDMWFQSHSSCPICRNPVGNQASSAIESIPIVIPSHSQMNTNRDGYNNNNDNAEGGLDLPTNVLFWGDEIQVRTLGNFLEEDHQSSQLPVPDPSSSSSLRSISNRAEGVLVISIPQEINGGDEEQKSPAPTRLRSLKRLLSRDTTRVSSSSPRDFDTEQQPTRS